VAKQLANTLGSFEQLVHTCTGTTVAPHKRCGWPALAIHNLVQAFLPSNPKLANARQGVELRARVLALIPLFFAQAGMAQSLPVVLFDSGKTVPSAQYFSHVLHGVDAVDESPLLAFPVQVKGLRPGVVSGKHRIANAQWLTQPLFVIGADEMSTQWLQKYRVAIQRLKASGIVVSVKDVQTFKALQRISEAPVAPHPAPGLVSALKAAGVTAYPVMVLTDGSVVQDLSAWNEISGVQP